MRAQALRKTRFMVRINPDLDLAALLDMLRYEHGNVVSWTHLPATADRGRGEVYQVTIECEDWAHQPDRWRSFGISPEARA